MKRAFFAVAALAMLASGCETAVDMAVGSQIDGVWKGKYYCGLGLPFNATLQVSLAGSAATGKYTLAVPRGDLDPPGPDRIFTSYTLNGTFDAPNLHLMLQPVSWVEGLEPTHPTGPVDATLHTDGKTLEVQKTKNCSPTLLAKQ